MERKIKFKDLNLPLKTLVVFGFISFGYTILIYLAAIIMLMMGI